MSQTVDTTTVDTTTVDITTVDITTVDITTVEASEARVAFVQKLPKTARVHISGVCGTGMASVLQLLKELGFYVTGSDKRFYPPMGEVVRREADKVFEGYAAENIDYGPDMVVIGNALSKENPEIQAVLEKGIPFASMPEVFAGLLIGSREMCRKSIVVTGTHGKTTTTSAIATVLDTAGLAPGYFIGGAPNNFSKSIRPVSTKLPVEKRSCVLEGDEYDSAFFAKRSKFVSYRPDIVIITSLEFDHADIYNSIEQIEEQFDRLAEIVPADGAILVCDQSERLKNLAAKWQQDPAVVAQIRSYGLDPKSPFHLKKRTPNSEGQKLDMYLEGVVVSTSSTMSGTHNAQNLVAAAAVASMLKVPLNSIQEGVANFRGARRRQQLICNRAGVTIIEDFAHHPTAIQVTLDGIREVYPDRRLIAVYEPRSNTSRRAFFQEQYPQSFRAADVVWLLELEKGSQVWGEADTSVGLLDVERLLADIRLLGKEAGSAPDVESLSQKLFVEIEKGGVFVVMSNGDFGGLIPKLLASPTLA